MAALFSPLFCRILVVALLIVAVLYSHGAAAKLDCQGGKCPDTADCDKWCKILRDHRGQHLPVPPQYQHCICLFQQEHGRAIHHFSTVKSMAHKPRFFFLNKNGCVEWNNFVLIIRTHDFI